MSVAPQPAVTTLPVTGTLAAQAMLVALGATQWSRERTNGTASGLVADQYGAPREDVRVKQRPFAREATREIEGIVSSARAAFLARTQPWLDGGWRILPSRDFLAFCDVMNGYRDRYDTAVNTFFGRYDAWVDEARVRLGGLFNPANYPPEPVARQSFTFSWHILPIPQAADFRVEVEEYQRQQIVRDIQAQEAERLEQVRRSIWRDIARVSGHLAERLAAYRPATKTRTASRLYASVVGSVAALAELVPGFNDIVGDPDLDAILPDLVALARFDTDDLKADRRVRRAIAAEAAAVYRRAAVKL